MMHDESMAEKAAKIFPISIPEQESSVMHARKKWIEVQKYISENNITIKPIIKVKKQERSNVVPLKTKAA